MRSNLASSRQHGGKDVALFEKLSPGKRRKSGKGKNRVTVRLQVYIYYGDENEGLTGRCNTITTKLSRTAALFSTPEQSKIKKISPSLPEIPGPDGHYKADGPDGRYEQVAKNGQSSLAVRHGPSAQRNGACGTAAPPRQRQTELDIDLDRTSLEAKSELTTRVFRSSKRLRALVPLMIDIVIREKEKAIIWCLVTTCRVANMRRVSWPNSTNNLPLSKPRPASETAKLSPLNSAMSIFYTFRQDTLLERADLLAGRTNKITEALVKLPAVDAPVLRPDAPQINWKRGTNVEAVLGQSRGQRKDLAKPCQPTRSRYCALRLRRSQGVFMLLPLATLAHH
ncbi:hypothetical protein FQN53_000492 [Emmonsiellopsis sp. PD_33]|nr:hypothetical protein FQN53_000492 [Emmonsiellopsis sp. PD_33]